MPLVDLVPGAEQLNALCGDRLGDEDPHAPTPAAAMDGSAGQLRLPVDSQRNEGG